MAYVNGSASNFADLQTALESACTSNGWTLTDGILNKSGGYFKLSNEVYEMSLIGGTSQTGATLNEPGYWSVKIMSPDNLQISFPVNYDIHIIDNEVILVINYNSAYYQTIAFGVSNLPGIGGSGAWYSGQYEERVKNTDNRAHLQFWNVTNFYVGTRDYLDSMTSPFFTAYSDTSLHSSFIHCGLDSSVAWRTHESNAPGSGLKNCGYLAGLLTSLPSLYNEATVLIPSKAVAIRTGTGVTIVANLENVRICRIDNIIPGAIVTFGSEQWIVYPFYRKDTNERNGVPAATGASHSGTFGFAIRYTGV